MPFSLPPKKPRVALHGASLLPTRIDNCVLNVHNVCMSDKRYNLVMPLALYRELRKESKLRGLTTAVLIREYIKYGLATTRGGQTFLSDSTNTQLVGDRHE